ncbi:DUF2279 domain-containing protein [Pontimicrobium sp. MEBiC06410]
MKKHILHLVFALVVFSGMAQSKLNLFLKPSDTLHKPRRNVVVITEATAGGLTLLGLNQLWYSDFERSKFHTINDNNEWLQMDKLGHAFTAYQVGRIGADVLHWSGVNKKDQLLYGATLGFSFLTAVEVLDGFSKEWGFSWGDFAANASGTGLYVGQELLWKEQRITLKYSFHRTGFAAQRPDKLGVGLLEESLKDYNGQTYWLSANLHSFFKQSKLPKWLNVAFGYGGEGLLAGTKAKQIELFGQHNRRRQYYLSLDIDLTKINTNSHILRTLFSIFNVVKVPLPTVEFTDKNDLKFHAIYF